MNYAVDRLDRRERFTKKLEFENINNSNNHQDDANYQNHHDNPKSASSGCGALSLDLDQAHSMIRCSFRHDTNDTLTTKNNYESHVYHKNENSSNAKSREAHSLAGRTLRDGGFCAQALFHFGMAWIYDPENAMAAGDYAQMADFSGYPEIGILSLLHFYSGGKILSPKSSLPSSNVEQINEHDGFVENIFQKSKDKSYEYYGNCGCGMSECNSNTFCFLPFDIHDLDSVLQTFSLLNGNILKSNSKLSSLFFWVDYPKSEIYGNDEDATSCRSHFRILPPVVKMLLLKLLYCNPIGGPFLHLACLSITPLSASIKGLDFLYKSHWAYFVLIKAMVEGWKVKPHRRDKVVPYHVPVKDILYGLDDRKIFGGLSFQEAKTNVEARVANKNDQDYNYNRNNFQKDEYFSSNVDLFVSYLRLLLKECSEKSNFFTGQNIQNDANDNHFSECDQNFALYHSFRIKCFFHSSHNYHPPIFIIGDSHSLSIAWQTIRIPSSSSSSISSPSTQTTIPSKSQYRTAIPCLATGIKAWHTSQHSKSFFTQYNLHVILSRLPAHIKSVIISMGEIDCREGIGGEKLQGYSATNVVDCDALVRRTVSLYVSSMLNLALNYGLQILLLPVAPHAYRSEKNGKATGRAKRRSRMEIWNKCLRLEVSRIQYLSNTCTKRNEVNISGSCEKLQKKAGVFLLDYEEGLRESNATSPTGYVLNKHYNADFTHMNSAFLPLLENALVNCGCDISLL